MPVTQAKVGAFFLNGEQVGGFFDYQLIVNLVDAPGEGVAKYKMASWSAEAESYWFENEVSEVEVRFFSDVAPYYWKGKTTLNMYGLRLGILIKESIQFKGNGILEAKKWTESN